MQMEQTLSALQSLPRTCISNSDLQRLDGYAASHSRDLERKRMLLRRIQVDDLSSAEDRATWLEAWKEAPVVQQTKAAELDDLAAALGSW